MVNFFNQLEKKIELIQKGYDIYKTTEDEIVKYIKKIKTELDRTNSTKSNLKASMKSVSKKIDGIVKSNEKIINEYNDAIEKYNDAIEKYNEAKGKVDNLRDEANKLNLTKENIEKQYNEAVQSSNSALVEKLTGELANAKSAADKASDAYNKANDTFDKANETFSKTNDTFNKAKNAFDKAKNAMGTFFKNVTSDLQKLGFKKNGEKSSIYGFFEEQGYTKTICHDGKGAECQFTYYDGNFLMHRLEEVDIEIKYSVGGWERASNANEDNFKPSKGIEDVHITTDGDKKNNSLEDSDKKVKNYSKQKFYMLDYASICNFLFGKMINIIRICSNNSRELGANFFSKINNWLNNLTKANTTNNYKDKESLSVAIRSYEKENEKINISELFNLKEYWNEQNLSDDYKQKREDYLRTIIDDLISKESVGFNYSLKNQGDTHLNNLRNEFLSYGASEDSLVNYISISLDSIGIDKSKIPSGYDILSDTELFKLPVVGDVYVPNIFLTDELLKLKENLNKSDETA